MTSAAPRRGRAWDGGTALRPSVRPSAVPSNPFTGWARLHSMLASDRPCHVNRRKLVMRWQIAITLVLAASLGASAPVRGQKKEFPDSGAFRAKKLTDEEIKRLTDLLKKLKTDEVGKKLPDQAPKKLTDA